MQAIGTERALAKLTRSLRVIGVRPDGYHLVESEMVTVDLADRLDFYEGSGLEVVGVGGSPSPMLPRGRDNLVLRALALAGRRARVRLEKRIPVAAGLAGGSADAAAVLRWAGFEDRERAATLGADVPFCQVGGRALVSGIGEQLEALEPLELEFVLLTPPLAVRTPAVYAAWDGLGGPTGEGPNDLERAAIAVEPRLAAWRDALQRATGKAPLLAGSGSTWFVEGSLRSLGLSGRKWLAVEGERAALVEARCDRP